MPRIVYQDEGITEYDDGTEEVHFSGDEWDRMLSDPAFGYICRSKKHRLNDSDRRWIESEGLCPHCWDEAEIEYAEFQSEEEAAIERGLDADAAHTYALMVRDIRRARGLSCRTLASGSLALYEPTTGKVVEIVNTAVEGFDAFAHIEPTEPETYEEWCDRTGADLPSSVTGNEVPDTWYGTAHGEAIVNGLPEHTYCPEDCGIEEGF
jgi:hypothetical protein